MFIFFILLYTFRLFKEAKQTGIKIYIKYFWTWIEIPFLCLSYAAIIYAIYRIVAIRQLLSAYSSSPNTFTNFYRTVLLSLAMQYVLAFLGFLVSIKVQQMALDVHFDSIVCCLTLFCRFSNYFVSIEG